MSTNKKDPRARETKIKLDINKKIDLEKFSMVWRTIIHRVVLGIGAITAMSKERSVILFIWRLRTP